MLLTQKTVALVALFASFVAPTPSIHIHNRSKNNICYKVEYSSAPGVFPNETVCGTSGPDIAGFWLNSSKSEEFDATGFNGAITAVLNNELLGARNEIDFTDPAKPFYDVDYQYGISDSTCGPPNSDSDHLAGERDTLGKANQAWHPLNASMKTKLLAYPNYIRQDAHGNLTYINMTLDAWTKNLIDPIYFFQATAQFKAYMCPGSVPNMTWTAGSVEDVLTNLADKQTHNVQTERIDIIAY